MKGKVRAYPASSLRPIVLEELPEAELLKVQAALKFFISEIDSGRLDRWFGGDRQLISLRKATELALVEKLLEKKRTN